MQHAIDEQGHLPEKLDGMKISCKEQRASASYLKLRARLQEYAKGKLTAEDIVPGHCDAPAAGP